jgi:hypothetical protein
MHIPAVGQMQLLFQHAWCDTYLHGAQKRPTLAGNKKRRVVANPPLVFLL